MSEQPEPVSPDTIENLEEQYVLGETSHELLLETSQQHIRITHHMATQATRSMKIFTRDLDPLIYDSPEFVEACKHLALRSPYARIEVLAFDSQRIIHRGHRMLELSRSLSSRVEIRRPEKHYEKHLMSFITFDEVGYVYKTYSDRYEGIANYNNPREAREFEKLFAEMWQRSQVDSEVRRLHI